MLQVPVPQLMHPCRRRKLKLTPEENGALHVALGEALCIFYRSLHRRIPRRQVQSSHMFQLMKDKT